MKKLSDKELKKGRHVKQEIAFRYLTGVDNISTLGQDSFVSFKKFELDGIPFQQKAIDVTRRYPKEEINFDLIIKVNLHYSTHIYYTYY